MKLARAIALLAMLLMAAVLAPVESRPTNSMTRIQEVFRTLMGSKPMVAHRGKKSMTMQRVEEPDRRAEDALEERLRTLWLLDQLSDIQDAEETS